MKEGILFVNKEKFKTSFSIIQTVRKILSIKKIGHAGTLDPLATGIMIILIGKNYTKKSLFFTNLKKTYIAKIQFGKISDTYDSLGEVKDIKIKKIPSLKEIEKILQLFQNEIFQTPPMFSAKKINGQKLYILARKKISIPRKPIKISIKTTLLNYSYPFLNLKIECSKGTYIRSIANDIGEKLNNCKAILQELVREKIGPFTIKNCFLQKDLSKKIILKNIINLAHLPHLPHTHLLPNIHN